LRHLGLQLCQRIVAGAGLGQAAMGGLEGLARRTQLRFGGGDGGLQRRQAFLSQSQSGLGALFAFRRCRQQCRIRSTEGLPVLLQPTAALHQVIQCTDRMALVGLGQAQGLLGLAQAAACFGDVTAGGLNRVLGIGHLRRRFAVPCSSSRRAAAGVVEQMLPARFVLRQLAVLCAPMGFFGSQLAETGFQARS
jgi:hypothetical protein